MRRTILLVSTALMCAGATEPDLRHVTWGMSQGEVLASEAGSPSGIRSSSGEVLVSYDSLQFGGLAGRLVYIFAKDKLVRVKYLFDADGGDPDRFIADYKSIEPVLRETYGAPASDRAYWQDDESQIERKDYLNQDRSTPGDLLASDAFLGQTLAAGHLKLYTEWLRERTRVLHGLTGDNNRITHQVEFRSVELEGLEDEVRAAAGRGPVNE